MDVCPRRSFAGHEQRQRSDGGASHPQAVSFAWRASPAQDTLDMALVTSLYPHVGMQKTNSGWVSGALHGIAGDSLQGIIKRRKKLSYYAARFRGERDNAIKRLHQRCSERSLS